MAEMSGVKMAEDVRAEIVASVLEVVVNEGDQIGKGDIVVLLESMKMEIPVLAEVDGTVSKVSVSVGDVIRAGDLIAVIS
jgi:acetyl-CoA carboxylase biotin carboxyl carrier protein